MMNNINLQDIPSILSYGFIGLGFLLALLTFILLVKVINTPDHRNSSVFLTSIFMIFSLLMAGGGAYIELVSKSKSADLRALKVEIDSLHKAKGNLAKELQDTQQKLAKVNAEISAMKAKPFNWDYKPKGVFFECTVDGVRVGARQDCREHDSCDNYNLNRGVCAHLYSGQVFN